MNRSASMLPVRLTALAAALLLGCAAPALPNGRVPAPEVGQPLPELPLRDLGSGQPLSLKSLAGRVVLLDIWASWCGPCKEELPLLDEMAGRLAGAGVEIVAVSIDEEAETVRNFLRQREKWNLRVAHDPQGKVPSELKPAKMPSSYLIDKSGVLKKIYGGFTRSDAARIENELKELASQ